MKTIHPIMSSVSTLTLALLVSVTSCQEENLGFNSSAQPPQASSAKSLTAPLTVDLMHFSAHIENADMQPPIGDATPLFNKNGGQHVPIMTPDGKHQVTLGEFNMISGSADVKCVNAGTHVVMHLKGLIPNGVYTIWTVAFAYPGFNGVSIPVNRIGFGALGAIEGSNNSNAFIANEEGNASISVIRPAGKLLTDGSVNPHPEYTVPNCMGNVFETHLALAYHLNNIAAAPGHPTTWAVQGFFQFWGSQLQ